ncbi:hypothetical protein TNCV_831791 [Trichonephila clavipes]|nr:hypothetical protein TNCV_831791 [Trichonephila clavipes]
MGYDQTVNLEWKEFRKFSKENETKSIYSEKSQYSAQLHIGRTTFKINGAAPRIMWAIEVAKNLKIAVVLLKLPQKANFQPCLPRTLAPKIVRQRILHRGHTETLAKSKNAEQREDW